LYGDWPNRGSNLRSFEISHYHYYAVLNPFIYHINVVFVFLMLHENVTVRVNNALLEYRAQPDQMGPLSPPDRAEPFKKTTCHIFKY